MTKRSPSDTILTLYVHFSICKHLETWLKNQLFSIHLFFQCFPSMTFSDWSLGTLNPGV